MHELSIAKDIVKQVRDKNPKEIIIEMGELAQLSEEELRNALSLFLNCEIIIKSKKGTAKCKKCGFTGKPRVLGRTHDYIFMKCPKCGGMEFDILEGKDIILKSAKVDV